MKIHKYSDDLILRLISWIDFDEYRRACVESQTELTEYLSLGSYTSSFIVTDYWNLFSHILRDEDSNLYGLFEGKRLLAVGSTFVATRPLGSQITYWVRNGEHGKGFGKYLLYVLLNRTFGSKGYWFAELIIDQENIASVTVAESLGLYKGRQWENFESGQGTRNSGKFAIYYAFNHKLEQIAERDKTTPLEILEDFWFAESLGVFGKDTFKPVRRPPEGGVNRINQTLRLAGPIRSPKP